MKSRFQLNATCFLLAVCFALIYPSIALALTSLGTQSALAGKVRQHEAPHLILAGLCPDGTYGCREYEEAPYVPPIDHAPLPSHAPPAHHYAPADPGRLPPCSQPDYAAHVVTRPVTHAPAPHYRKAPPPAGKPYIVYEEDACGVRCWYRRLLAGYCGRGCDYYIFRRHGYPTGNLKNYGRRTACSIRY